jgi:oligosaccharide repeat unit polymerase
MARSSLLSGETMDLGLHSATPRAAPFLATMVAIALAGLAPTLIVAATPEVGYPSNSLGPMLIAVLAALRLAAIVGASTRRLFEMVFWLYVYVFLGVAPMIQMRLGADTDTAPNVNHYLDWQTTGVVLIGCAAFLIGVLARPSQQVIAGTEDVPLVSPLRANLLTFATLGIFAYYASRIGFGTLFKSRDTLDLARSMAWGDKTTTALIVGVTTMGLLVSAIAQIQVRRQRKQEGRPAPAFLPCISFVALIICVNPISSARYAFGTVFLALIGALGAYKTVKRFRVVTLGAVFGLVYMFPVADMFRRSLDPSAKSQNPLESMLSGDFDSFSQITNTIDYVAANGISWGNQMLGVLFFWVPRSLWPNKPLDTGPIVAEWKMYFFKNLSSPLWAEFFINGGWVFVVIGMLVVGLAVGRLDRKSEAVLSTTGQPSVIASILPFYLLIVLRGSLLQSVSSMAVILLASAFVRTKTNKESNGDCPRGPAMIRRESRESRQRMQPSAQRSW